MLDRKSLLVLGIALLGATVLFASDASARGFTGGANRSFGSHNVASGGAHHKFVNHGATTHNNFVKRSFTNRGLTGNQFTAASHTFHSSSFSSPSAGMKKTTSVTTFPGNKRTAIGGGVGSTPTAGSNTVGGQGTTIGGKSATIGGGAGSARIGGSGGFPVPSYGGGGNVAPVVAAPVPAYTPASRPNSPAPAQSCFRKIYQDKNMVLIDMCTQQEVIVPPGGNECLMAEDASAGSVWFADKCAMQQVLTPPAASMEALALMYKRTADPN